MTLRQILLTILNIVSAFLGVVIGMRVVFLLAGANPSTPVVIWINNMSSVLLYPFNGLFQTIILNSRSAIDITAIAGLIIYTIIFALLYRAVYLLTHEDTVSTQAHSHSESVV